LQQKRLGNWKAWSDGGDMEFHHVFYGTLTALLGICLLYVWVNNYIDWWGKSLMSKLESVDLGKCILTAFVLLCFCVFTSLC